jgi:hypothetical protein
MERVTRTVGEWSYRLTLEALGTIWAGEPRWYFPAHGLAEWYSAITEGK